jgi:hypothetical protein
MLEIHRNDVAEPRPPDVIRDGWTWQPIPDGPVLELNLLDILERYEDAKQFFEPYLLRWRAAQEALTVPPKSR